MTATDAARVWLPLGVRPDSSDVRLFCLPHAGGAASAFRAWLDALPGIEVLPVQPPGREGRMREQPYERIEDLVDQLAALIEQVAQEQEFALYGHSLGALVAFETARELRRSGARAPTNLIVSGAPPPQKSNDRGKRVSTMPTDELVEMMRRLGGTPEWILSNPELLDMVLPAIRGDFAMRESYRYRREAGLEVPITVIASDSDPRAPRRQQARWKEQTTAAFEMHTLRGGHFAVFEEPESMQRCLAGAMGPAAGV